MFVVAYIYICSKNGILKYDSCMLLMQLNVSTSTAPGEMSDAKLFSNMAASQLAMDKYVAAAMFVFAYFVVPVLPRPTHFYLLIFVYELR